MEEVISHGITKEFLEDALKSKVKSFSVKPGSNHGDNYTSILHSIEVQLENQDKPIYLLLKVYPNHPMRKKFLDETNLFLKELLVYQNVVPALHNIINPLIGNKNKMKLKLSVPPLVSGKAVDYSLETGKLFYL